MADITDHHDQVSPSALDDHANGNSVESRGVKRQRTAATADDDDDDDDKPGRERRKIEIKFITDKSRRHITFSKRKAGIMKKVGFQCLGSRVDDAPTALPIGTSTESREQAYELSVLTGTQVLLLVVSETGLVYTFTTPKLQPLVTKAEGKNLIQACLNAPEPVNNGENGVDDQNTVDSPEEPAPQHLPPQQGRTGMPQQQNMHPGYMPQSLEQQQALAYQNYVAQQQRSGYPMPPQGGIPQQHSHQA
ncbi:hypothetical protein B2J93_962 [Marssonina coronariae]|uniref:MADS-box domain-containing protein n=1 Tax=Diplocarpon coronariae TaxID=2795749 RepID=A0A218ZDL7_9HELO|nr:hypothetical protein B2J93_962 [Marssonina coronariae]